MKKIISEINAIKKSSQKAFKDAQSTETVEQARVEFLGRKGKIAQLMPTLKNLSVEEKREVGPKINKLKKDVEALFLSKQQDLLEKSFEKEEEKHKDFDVTAYKTGQSRGSLHPYTHLTQEVCAIFKSMGYEIVDGPEVET